MSSNGNYDPHLHREVSNGLSNGAAMVHLLKGAVGSGLLAMPDAIKNSGYICGPIATVCLAFIITYCTHMLMRCRYAVSKKHHIPDLSYAESMRLALLEGPSWLRSCSNSSVHVVNWLLIINQVGLGCVYVNFVAENVQKVVVQADVHMDVKIYMLLLLVPLTILNCIPNLKMLAPLSMVANIFTVIGISTVMYYLLRDGLSLEDRNTISDISRWPLFFGTTFFSLQSIGVILPVEYKMKNPKDFGKCCGVMNQVVIIITTVYIFVGVSGYLKYGESVKGSVTLNLPEEEIWANTISIMYALAILISHPLQLYLAIQILWDDYLKKHFTEGTTAHQAAQYILRITVVLITVLLAIAIPKLAPIISLKGSLAMPPLGIIFPATMEICIAHAEHGESYNWILYRNLLVILFGFIGTITGTYVAVEEMFD